jgi:hypothetical protein
LRAADALRFPLAYYARNFKVREKVNQDGKELVE